MKEKHKSSPVHDRDLRRITLVPYTREWEEMYHIEFKKLKDTFGGFPITFFHIGSTSIPSCAAKPIIDILGVTPDVLRIDSLNQALKTLGYEALGEFGMRQRRFFQKRIGGNVNLHIFEDSDPEAARHLRFRDFLSAHPGEVIAYSQLKRELAERYPEDIKQYILGKESFIKKIDRQAVLEDTGNYWRSAPRKSTWSHKEILDAMDVNMQLMMTYFAKYIPESQIVYEPDILVVCSTIRDNSFNYLIGAHFQEGNVSQRITDVLSHFKKENLPFSWWVSERDTPNTLAAELQKQGLQFTEDDIGMYVELDSIQPSRHIAELSIDRVLTLGQLQDFTSVLKCLSEGSDVYDQFFTRIPLPLIAEGAPYEMYVGYVEKKPVVTGILVMHANVAGIYYITTDSAYRKKGYGTDMMRALLSRAKNCGYHLSTLQASASGRSLYEKLGFQSICRFVEYGPIKKT